MLLLLLLLLATHLGLLLDRDVLWTWLPVLARLALLWKHGCSVYCCSLWLLLLSLSLSPLQRTG